MGLDPSPYLTPDEDLYDAHHPVTNVIRWAKEAGLQVILVGVCVVFFFVFVVLVWLRRQFMRMRMRGAQNMIHTNEYT